MVSISTGKANTVQTMSRSSNVCIRRADEVDSFLHHLPAAKFWERVRPPDTALPRKDAHNMDLDLRKIVSRSQPLMHMLTAREHADVIQIYQVEKSRKVPVPRSLALKDAKLPKPAMPVLAKQWSTRKAALVAELAQAKASAADTSALRHEMVETFLRSCMADVSAASVRPSGNRIQASRRQWRKMAKRLR